MLELKMSRNDTFSRSRLVACLLSFATTASCLMLGVPQAIASGAPAQSQSLDLQDACRDHFNRTRQTETQLETLKNQPLRIVRLGGELDVALYDRLASVRRQKIAAASVAVRTAQSALSGCLARQLSIQQNSRMPAAVVETQPIRQQIPASVARPIEQVPALPVDRSRTCDPSRDPNGCRVRVGQ